MKVKFIILMLFFFSSLSINAQNWQWAKSNGGDSLDRADIKMLCIDNSGSSYYCGTFSSNPCYFHTDTLVPNGLYDMFIAKYDANGNEMWVKGFGGHNAFQMQQEGIYSITFNLLTRSIVISGSHYGTATFGNDTLNGIGGFLASIDTGGEFNWVKSTQGGRSTVDDLGNIYCQYYYNTPGTIDTFQVSQGIWIAKYNSGGQFMHAKKAFDANISNYDGYFLGMKAKRNRLFCFGYLTTDTLTIDTITVHANFPSDQYVIACFDTSGSALWVKPTGGRNPHNYSDIEVDDDLNSYITGPFSGNAIFDGDTIQNSTGGHFTAKFDSSGNFIWVDDQSSFLVWDLALDNENTIYLLCKTSDTASACSITIISTGSLKSFILRMDSAASCISLIQFDDYMGASAIVCDNYNKLLVSGTFVNSVTLGGSTIISLGIANSYIAKMDALTGIGEGERKTNTLLIYANPNDGKCNITIPAEFRNERKLVLSIFDITGKLVQQGSVEMNEDKVRVNLEAEAKGIYNVTLSNGKKSYGGKIIFE